MLPALPTHSPSSEHRRAAACCWACELFVDKMAQRRELCCKSWKMRGLVTERYEGTAITSGYQTASWSRDLPTLHSEPPRRSHFGMVSVGTRGLNDINSYRLQNPNRLLVPRTFHTLVGTKTHQSRLTTRQALRAFVRRCLPIGRLRLLFKPLMNLLCLLYLFF